MKLSAALIARDEAQRIARCLESLRWVDEIVVVTDPRTTDDTAGVAGGLGARVLTRAFDSYAGQRQWAADQCSGDWILWLDCDEVVSEPLAREIRRALEAPAHDAYRVPRLDYMFGRWIRHGGWYPQYHVRLYRRGCARWERIVHETLRVSGSIGSLREPMRHYSHQRVEDWVAKMADYTTLEARALHDAGARMGALRIVIEPPLYFGYKFIVQQGWRDGLHGLVLASLLGGYRLVRNLKLWDLRQSERGPRESEDCPPPMSRS